MSDNYKQYPRGSVLWTDGLAMSHWRTIRCLGYKNCDCDWCQIAEQIMLDAIEENKSMKPRSILKWLRKEGRHE